MKLKALLIALLLVACGVSVAADRKYIVNPRPGDTKALPFSDAVLVGDTLYVAGHIGVDPKTGQAPADAEVEANLVMDGVKKTVEGAGFSMDDRRFGSGFLHRLEALRHVQWCLQDILPRRFSGASLCWDRQTFARGEI